MSSIEYEDKILNFFDKAPNDYEKDIDKLTDNKEKFISTVKKLMDEGHLKYLNFSNDYKRIKKYII